MQEGNQICGLVGVAGFIGLKGEKLFKRLLELDTLRGPHSTGILNVDSNGDTFIAKQLGTPWELYEHKSCEELFRKTSCLLLGHNRFATKGKVNKQNAHPFEFKTVAGAHNGTLYSTKNLDDHKDFEVDSENIYHHMDKHGVYDTIPLLDGAFALTWYNKKDKTINFIRNEQRPLFYAMSKDNKTLAWASESWMITVASGMAEIEMNPPMMLAPGFLHTFEVPMGFPTKEFNIAKVRKLELYAVKKPTLSVTATISGRTTNSGTTNVVVIKKIPEKVKRPFSEYQKYVGKPCTFYVGNSAISGSKQAYLQCWASADDDISIRVFPVKDSYLWTKMMESPNHFSGTARAYNGLDGGYLTIDIRTIKEVVDDDPDVPFDTDEIKGFDGEVIDAETFKSRAKRGCAWCGSPVLIDDHEDVLWIEKEDLICPDCTDQPEVKQYLTH